MKKLLLSTLWMLLLANFSCKKDTMGQGSTDDPISISKIEGVIQKGPFLNGTSITIFELTTNFSQTGRSFNAQTRDNTGNYTLSNLQLASPFIEIRADGFYFNEVLNRNSTSQLTLSAISNVTDKTSLNVNLLSTLEKERVLHLISQGKTFSEAKTQAKQEILSIFDITPQGTADFESLDIVKDGEENAILLAISVILQSNFQNVADLSQLVANIKSDILQDGILNDANIGTQLVNNAKRLDKAQIRANLTAKIAELGLPGGVVPPFEKYIDQFLNNTSFGSTSGITYPETGKFGPNILSPTITTSTTSPKKDYSLRAILEEGTKLKVRITATNILSQGDQQNTGWTYDLRHNTHNTYYIEYTANRTGDVDYFLYLTHTLPEWPQSGKVVIEAFENDDVSPTWTKEISLTDLPAKIFYPQTGINGFNLLHPGFIPPYLKRTNVDTVRTCSINALLFPGLSLSVKISAPGWEIPNLSMGTGGWTVSDIDPVDNSRTFTLNNYDRADLMLLFRELDLNNLNNPPVHDIFVQIFENGATTPTRQFYLNIEP